MNEHDRKNLNFILTRNHDELSTWFCSIQDSMDPAEIDYALDLMMQARCLVELDLLALVDQDAEDDISIAADYLQQFRL